MNVSELARKLNTTTSELLEILPQLGFDVGAKAIKVSDHLVEKITSAYKDYQKKIKFEEEQSKITEIKIADKNKEEVIDKKIIQIDNNIIIRDLAEKMNLPLSKVMGELMKNGIMLSLNSTIDFETASIITEDLGFQVEKSTEDKKEKIAEEEKIKRLNDLLDLDKNKKLKPPVVVVMGHVDHGKTKLLDAIRKTNIIDTESGNITQHIGAYGVEINGKKITFLDTPGHEAFKAMRSRGTKIADIGIIVVAADEGLKPQTVESIELAHKENLPFIIAINKIDKPEANIEKVKKELSELNLIPEDWGGKTICVGISAKEGKNITELLEMINLVAEMENLQADDTRKAIGTIIESHIDKNQGPVATVLIQTGTLYLGDNFISGNTYGKVRSMSDHLNRKINSAGPSTPVKILGFKDAPVVGDIFNAEIKNIDMKDAKKNTAKTNGLNKNTSQTSSDKDEDLEKKSLNIIIKTDVVGSQGAIIEALNKLEKDKNCIDNNIEIKIVKSGLGAITDQDILDAETTNSIILGFHVNANNNAELIAKEKNIQIRIYKIIYKLLEDIEEILKTMISEKTIREEVGNLRVLEIFKTLSDKMVVGGKVLEGKIIKDAFAKIIRNNKCVAIGKITNLQSAKENINEITEGAECGLEFSGDPIIKKDDIIEVYKEKIVN